MPNPFDYHLPKVKRRRLSFGEYNKTVDKIYAEREADEMADEALHKDIINRMEALVLTLESFPSELKIYDAQVYGDFRKTVAIAEVRINSVKRNWEVYTKYMSEDNLARLTVAFNSAADLLEQKSSIYISRLEIRCRTEETEDAYGYLPGGDVDDLPRPPSPEPPPPPPMPPLRTMREDVPPPKIVLMISEWFSKLGSMCSSLVKPAPYVKEEKSDDTDVD